MKNRILSTVLGLLAILLLVEVLLSTGAWVFNRVQTQRAMKYLTHQADEVRILALGESTTSMSGDESGLLLVPQTSYPSQLEKILNERQPQVKYRVVNGGIMGGNTSLIVASLAEDLKRYRPHIIVAMMGMKDQPRQDNFKSKPFMPSDSFLANLSLVKLVKWSYEAVWLRRNQVLDVGAEGLDRIPEHLRLGIEWFKKYIRETQVSQFRDPGVQYDLFEIFYLFVRGRYPQAESQMEAFVKAYGVGHGMLARLKMAAGKNEEAFAVLRKAIALTPKEGMYRVTLAELLVEVGRIDEADRALAEAERLGPTFFEAGHVGNFMKLARADLQRRQGHFSIALGTLRSIKTDVRSEKLDLVFPDVALMRDGLAGEICFAMKDYGCAEEKLTKVVRRYPLDNPYLWTLGELYRETGRPEMNLNTRMELLEKRDTALRLADYYEILKVLKLMGRGDQVPKMFEQAAERIPSLRANYQHLFKMARENNIKLYVMQYPSFSTELMAMYVDKDSAVEFIDNEHIFDAAPEKYFFEPRYPYSFAHFTKDGAKLVAENVANHILKVVASKEPLKHAGN